MNEMFLRNGILIICVLVVFVRFVMDFKQKSVSAIQDIFFKSAFLVSIVLLGLTLLVNVLCYPALKGQLVDGITMSNIFWFLIVPTFSFGSIVSTRFNVYATGRERGSSGTAKLVHDNDSPLAKTTIKILLLYFLGLLLWTIFSNAITKATSDLEICRLFSGGLLVFVFWDVKSAYLILVRKDDASQGVLVTGKKNRA